MKRLYNLDVLKFVCAVLIIFLHDRTPYTGYVLPITRCAVPCFFIISGYLIFNADKEKFVSHLKNGIPKMLRIMAWSTALFAVVKFLFAFKHNDLSFLSWKALVDFILLNENPFGFHLWYIGAYLYVLIIVYLLLQKGKLKWFYYAIPFFLIADLCFGKYSLLIWHREFPVVWLRNFLFVGIPYFTIGMMLKQYKSIILNHTNLHLLASGGVILFSLTSILENRMLVHLGMNATRDHYISSTFLAVSLFISFLSFKYDKPSFLSVLGEKDSLYIYIFHPLFLLFFSTINSHLPTVWQEFYLYCSPVLILVITITFTKILWTLHIIK